MKEKFIDKFLNFITKYEECDRIKLLRLKYGLEGIFNLMVKTSVVILLSFLLGTTNITLMTMVFYALLRTFSFGFHANSSIGCWITTITVYNIIPLILKNITIPHIIGYIILFISVISMILWAPADTPKRPLLKKEVRKKCKRISTSIVILYAVIYLLNFNSLINDAIMYALMIQTVFINPVTYKITRTPFNNYKYYKKKESKEV